MPAQVDFYFVGMRRGASKTDRRVNGYFLIPEFGFACKACSGSSRLYPVPAGRYLATDFRDRSESAMTRDGVGFSVNLSDKWDPAANRMRSLLRIHPDGGLPGTEGCVGILGRVNECRDILKTMLASGNTRVLEVIVASKPSEMSICTAYGCFVFG